MQKVLVKNANHPLIYRIPYQSTPIPLHFLQKKHGNLLKWVTKRSNYGLGIKACIYQLGTGLSPD
jgi:hypothetical protein